MNENRDWYEPASRRELLIAASLIILGLIGFIVFVVKFWIFTADDAFITFRYAQNVVKGWGLTFNQRPPRAEGYTSLLWTLMMTLPHLAGVDAVLFSKFAGSSLMVISVFVLALGILTMPQAGTLKNRILGATCAVLLFLTFPYGPVHAVSGMETALAVFGYITTTVLFLHTQEDSQKISLLSFSCLLLSLTRPEANLFALSLLAIILLYVPVPARRAAITRIFVLYILPGLVYFLWRYRYYGMLLPLPFYIKSGSFGLLGFAPTVAFVQDLAIGFTFPLYLFVRSASARRCLILIPVVALLGYFMMIDHIMGYGHRYFFPLVPVLALLAGLGVSMKLRTEVGNQVEVVFLLSTVLACAIGFTTTSKSIEIYQSYARGMNSAHILLGRTLAKIPWSSQAVLAIGDAGAVPYYSGLETVDIFGLNDPAIAMNFHADHSVYVLSKTPLLIALISKYEDHFEAPLEHENTLFQSSIDQGYVRHVTFVFQDDYYLWVLWRPGTLNENAFEDVLVDAARQSHELVK